MASRKRACLPFVAALASSAVLLVASSTEIATQVGSATGVTVFEGARLITADGSAPIENSAFIVANDTFTAVGRITTLTSSTSYVLPVGPGTWYYRVRGLNAFIPGNKPMMSWSDPTKLVVTRPSFRVVR